MREVEVKPPDVVPTTSVVKEDGGLFGLKNNELAKYLEPINPYETPYEQYTTSMDSTNDYTNAWPARLEKLNSADLYQSAYHVDNNKPTALPKAVPMPYTPTNFYKTVNRGNPRPSLEYPFQPDYWDYKTPDWNDIQRDAAKKTLKFEAVTANPYVISGKIGNGSGITVAGGVDLGSMYKKDINNLGERAGIPHTTINSLEKAAAFGQNKPRIGDNARNTYAQNQDIQNIHLSLDQSYTLTKNRMEKEAKRAADTINFDTGNGLTDKEYMVAFDLAHQHGVTGYMNNFGNLQRAGDNLGLIDKLLDLEGSKINVQTRHNFLLALGQGDLVKAKNMLNNIKKDPKSDNRNIDYRVRVLLESMEEKQFKGEPIFAFSTLKK
ncbi:MAG: hypothetical protein ACOYK8_00450 [Alphaproteobacteria bacterium]